MRRPRSTTALIAGTASLSLLLAGCTGTEDSGKSATADGMIKSLNFGDFGGGTSPKANYNPFLPAFRLSAADYVHERLMIVEGTKCREIPGLATSYTWTDPKTLVFDIRDGVKWNDGEEFTAEDVVFTFNLIKKYDALDFGGLWGSDLKSVKATGAGKVTFSFAKPGATAFTVINGVPIVPEHIWSKVKDPTTFANAKDPVGTGPFTVKSLNPRRLVIERNPDYWQADKVKVKEIRFNKADAGGQVEQLKLSRGEYDQQGQFIPDIKKSYVDRDPEHHKYWYAPGGSISVYMNLTKKPFDDVEFRRALTKAFNDQKVIKKAQLGYVKEASQTGLVVPGQEKWLPKDIKDQGRIAYDPKAADKALTEAGYKKDSQGRRLGKNGKPVSFTFKVPGDYTDWVASADIVIGNLKSLGFQVEKDTPTPDAHNEDRQTGQYDMMFGVHGGSCNMYSNFSDPLNSAKTAPIGKKAATNEVRWKDAKTDKLLGRLKSATSEKDQKEAVAGLSRIMVDEVPMIPIWYGAKWFQYKTTKAVGWPSAKNPYASAADPLVWMTHLKPAKD
ncbi:MAG: ABC transporter substrate-binding protein [Streptomyces sp.]